MLVVVLLLVLLLLVLFVGVGVAVGVVVWCYVFFSGRLSNESVTPLRPLSLSRLAGAAPPQRAQRPPPGLTEPA